jgi:hypothetical protein
LSYHKIAPFVVIFLVFLVIISLSFPAGTELADLPAYWLTFATSNGTYTTEFARPGSAGTGINPIKWESLA